MRGRKDMNDSLTHADFSTWKHTVAKGVISLYLQPSTTNSYHTLTKEKGGCWVSFFFFKDERRTCPSSSTINISSKRGGNDGVKLRTYISLFLIRERERERAMEKALACLCEAVRRPRRESHHGLPFQNPLGRHRHHVVQHSPKHLLAEGTKKKQGGINTRSIMRRLP